MFKNPKEEHKYIFQTKTTKKNIYTKIYDYNMPISLLQFDTNSDNKIISNVAEIKQKMKTIAKRGLFLENNDTCPTCSQTIENKDAMLAEAKVEAQKTQEEMNGVEVSNRKIQDDINDAEQILYTIREKTNTINANNREISSLNQSNSDLKTYLEEEVTTDLDQARTELTNLNLEKEELFEEKLKINEQFNYNGVLAEMLRDTGIKTKIIKQYLPVINKLVNQYLQVLDFFVHFDLDENFNETIRSRHRDDFVYESFSEGEKQRIDLSLLFTWRQIAKMKNSVSTNLLILDETFDSSLDHDGIENLLKILHTLDNDTNTFIISHKGDILDGKFETKIEFVKDRNFSKIKI